MQTCGDAHVANFGKFATPERRLVFDINDFDETLPGPWEWDVKRLCASMHIAAREHGFSKAESDASCSTRRGRTGNGSRSTAACAPSTSGTTASASRT